MATAHVGTYTAPIATIGERTAPIANPDIASRVVHIAEPVYAAPAGHVYAAPSGYVVAAEAAHGVGVVHDSHV